MSQITPTSIDPQRVSLLHEAEQRRFDATHPGSRARFEQGQRHWLYGAPSHWMRRWIGGAPLYIREAQGARLTDVDGHVYADFCLGDTGGMCGHGHPAIAQAVATQLARGGGSMMLPTDDAAWVGEELQRRFGLPYWNLTTSASDANRACIRLARMVTGRPRVLVFSGCYHGSVEEAHVELVDGKVGLRNGIDPNAFDHQRLSAVVEFNDLPALEQALAAGDVACVLTEPVMTNYGIIAPEPGFLDALRAACTRHGSLLIVDETHTLSSGPRGHAAPLGLQPDMFVVGKAIAGGIPAAAFGVAEAVAQRIWQRVPKVSPTVRQSAHLGFGGTLAGNAVSVAAIRAVLEQVLTAPAFERMIGLATRLEDDIGAVIGRHRLPWHALRVGARVETMFAPRPVRNASEFRASRDGALEALVHLWMLNRGVLITPFHLMLLICPATTDDDVARHRDAFAELADALTSASAAVGG